jgi:hypothetical protein
VAASGAAQEGTAMMSGDKDTLIVIAICYLMLVVMAAAFFGLLGLLVAGLMGASGWYGYAIGHDRGWRHSSEWRMGWR